MNKLRSVEDLNRLRIEQQQAQRVKRAVSTQITIGMGTCGIAAGARETMAAIRQELSRRCIDAEVLSTGCIGMCAKEPLVDIQQAGHARVTYVNVLPEMVEQIIEEHLVQGRPVRQWILARLPLEAF